MPNGAKIRGSRSTSYIPAKSVCDSIAKCHTNLSVDFAQFLLNGNSYSKEHSSCINAVIALSVKYFSEEALLASLRPIKKY